MANHKTEIVTIANGSGISSEIATSGWFGAGTIQFSAVFTGTQVTIQARNGDTFADLMRLKSDGTLEILVIPFDDGSQIVELPTAALSANAIRFVSDAAEAADRELIVCLKNPVV